MAAKNSSRSKAESEVDESGPETPVLPVQGQAEQFPATDGTAEGAATEVVQRAGGGDGTVFERTFLLSGPELPTAHPVHRANAAAVVQEAMQRGLHARGDVHLTGTEEQHTRRSVSTAYTYAVEVVPASTDAAPEDTTTPAEISEANSQ